MNRHSRRSVLALLIAVIAGGRAAPSIAEPAASPGPGTPVLTASGVPGQRIAVDTPPERYATPAAAAVSPTIYLNRCSGGCTVHQGNNDARTDTSSIPQGAGDFHVSEFQDSSGNIGAAANADWALLMQCMKEVYSPYNVTITDVRPANGLNFHEAIIAGNPQEVGLDDKILGVAPLSTACAAIDNVMSFSFANHHTRDALNANVLVLNVCWTAAQESAHAYGLDHEYSFTTANSSNAHSACNDPMTYRNDCGGEKFFRNDLANCGETASRDCKCSGTQNSHQKLISVFGAGTPITGVPSIALTSPAAGGTLGPVVGAMAGSKRGVSHVDLYLNGYKWSEKPGAVVGANGQINPSSYALNVPDGVPNSVIDIKAIAFDDIGGSSESAVVTVTKGAPCASASTCAKGQKCEAGKCFWDPPAGEIGDSCSYAQFCKSGLCTGTADQQICTQSCIPGVADSCPANSGLECLMQGPNTGVCFFSTTGGCCSVSGGGGLWWVHASLALAVLGWITRRRRR
jgi:MYXO-CTERM domain-containing protein